MKLRLDATPEELHLFMAETDELLQRLDEQLIRLEQDRPSAALLQEVFRAAHTIKSTMGHLGAAAARDLAAEVEGLGQQEQLDAARPAAERLDREMERVLAGLREFAP